MVHIMNIPNKLIFAVMMLSSLAACSGGSDSSSVEQQPVLKVAPTATVADDFSADENTSVSLDGSKSLDSDGSINSYAWVQTSGSHTVEITESNQAIASFIAPDVDADTSLAFELTVTDNDNQTSTDSVKVDILRKNKTPIATAPTSVSAIGNNKVTLDGSGSTDPDGSIASYTWEQISGSPAITINKFSQSATTFTAPNVTTEFVFKLTVTDNEGATDSTTVKLKTTQVVANQAPIASVPESINTTGNYNVILNGSASSDSDGTITSYSWAQTFGASVQISNANQALAIFTAPNINSQLVFQLTVMDNNGATSSDSITVNIQQDTTQPSDPVVTNQAPTAIAANSSSNENAVVTLNGSASNDSDGSIVSYSWVQTSGSNVAISGANQAVASFTAPEVDADTQLRFQLTVTDNDGASSSASNTVTIQDVVLSNQAPTAVAGSDFSVDENTTQTLDGSASTDSDGTITSYSWVQTSGVNVVISGANQSVATFTAPSVDEDTQLAFQLTVTDDKGASNTDTVSVTIIDAALVNEAPVASAGNNISADENTSVSLDGSDSSDSDGAVTSYSWVQTAGSPMVAINNPTSANASFTAPGVTASTTLTFELMVTDNEGAEATDTVNITINPFVESTPQTNEIARAASRTTGAAPLSVFFTAGFSNSTPSNREFHDLEYNWNFGDVSSGSWATSNESKNTGKGPVASHVFEKPGTYTVNLSVRNSSGIVDSDTFTITVTDPDVVFAGDKTTCFSDVSNDNFTGCPAGATQVTTDNLAEMSNYVGSGRRALLHRGSVWTQHDVIRFQNNSTTVQISAYGAGTSADSQGIYSNAPVIHITGTTRGLFDIDQVHDMRIFDINVMGNDTTTSAGSNGVVDGLIDIRQLLVMRVKASGLRHGVSWSHWRKNGDHKITENSIVSCNFSDTYSSIIYAGSEKLSLMGNIIADTRTSHALRVWYAHQGVISHNIVSGASYGTTLGRHALKFHGITESEVGTYAETGENGLPNRTKFTQISHNVFGGSGPWTVAIGPQSSRDVYNEHLSDIIIEKNKVLASYGSQALKPAQYGLKFAGRYFTARNNILDGTGGADGYTGIHVSRRGVEPTPLGNRVYNNTIYRNGSAPWGVVGIEVHGTASDTIVRNNFVSFPGESDQLLVEDNSGNAEFDHNIINDNHGFVDPDNSVPLLRDFSLKSTSPAINQGTVVPVFDDFHGVGRINDTYSVGAFHY